MVWEEWVYNELPYFHNFFELTCNKVWAIVKAQEWKVIYAHKQ